MPEISVDTANQLISALQGLSSQVDRNTEGLTLEQKARQDAIKAADTYKSGLSQATSSLKSFGSAIMDTTSSFSKYEGSINQLGQAISTATSMFGPLGKAIGAAISAMTPLVGAVLKQTDNLVKSYDDLSKLGGAVGLSSKEIYSLGKSADFTSGTLNIFTKGVKEFGPNLKQLGDSTSQGVKAFTSFVAVGDDQLRKYRQLGFSQQDLIDAQTQYAKQQAEGGGLLVKTPKELQKASLAYIDNLLVLSELTGIEVAKQQEAQNFAMAQENFNAYRFSELQKATELEKQGRKAEADQIREVVKNKDEFARMAASTMSASNATAVLETISNKSGAVYTENSAKLAMVGIDMVKMSGNLNKGVNQTGELLGQQAKAVKNFDKQYGESAYAYGAASRDLQQTMGMDNKMRQSALMFETLETEEGKKKFTADMATKQKELEARKEGNDQLMKNKAGLESLERSARQFADTVMDKINPFTGSITNASLAAIGLAGAAGAASLALSSFALKAGGAATAGAAAAASKGASMAGKVGVAGAAALGVGMAAEAAQSKLGAETTGGKMADVAGTAAQFAAIGMMAGPKGALALGAIGAGYGLYKNFMAGDEIDKVLSFTSKSGSRENFMALDDDFRARVIAAATEYHAATGKKLQINSAYRDMDDQIRLWEESKAAGREGKTASGMPIANPYTGKSKHNLGLAVDIQNHTDPKALEALNKQGLQQTVKGDPVHFAMPKAMFGAVTNGPMTGYPVEHHGLEITAPLKADSILMKLAETTSNQVEATNTVTNNVTEVSSPQLEDLLTKLGEKMDMVVDRLSTANDYQDKLVKYSMV